jgi:hypothetical protein
VIKIIKKAFLMQPTKSHERMKQQTDAKSSIMETTEKIQAGLKSELRSDNDPLVDFTRNIKQIGNQNFIVEWQMGEKEIRKSNENLAYGSTFF